MKDNNFFNYIIMHIIPLFL